MTVALALSDREIELPSSESQRWGICFAVILALHVAVLWFALALSPEPEPLPAGAPPVAVIELVPLPVAAPVVAPPPPEPVTPPQPPEETAPPSPAPVIEAPLPPRPKPMRRPPPHLPPPILAAPAPSPVPPMPAPPVPMPVVSAPRPSNAAPSWQSAVLARLERFKRYPPLAQFRHQQGVVSLRFTIDRQGHVLAAQIAKSSGYDALDDEALALIQRAAPMPAPPPEMPGATLALTVPVQFFLK